MYGQQSQNGGGGGGNSLAGQNNFNNFSNFNNNQACEYRELFFREESYPLQIHTCQNPILFARILAEVPTKEGRGAEVCKTLAHETSSRSMTGASTPLAEDSGGCADIADFSWMRRQKDAQGFAQRSRGIRSV